MMVSTFDALDRQISEGIKGKNQFIPIGLPKLGRYANIRKKIFTLIFSNTGVGKSSLLDTWILNAVNYHMEHGGMKPDFQLFSFERSKELRLAKWVCFLIFIKEGVEIQLPKMLGWWEEKLTPVEYSLVKKQKEYIDFITNEYITIHDGAKSPKEVYKIMKDHFEEVGEYDKIKKIDVKTGKERETSIYIPKEPDTIVIPVYDHGNLTKTSQEFPSKKQAIDKLVTYNQMFRDLEGASPIWISQVNRAITGVTRQKDSEQEIMLDDIKESGDIADASDIAISLWDPLKFGQSSKTGYKPEDFVDKSNGVNYFRSAQILKSSYGMDSIRIPLAFNGFCGQFKELEKRKDLSDNDYQDLVKRVLNKQYFLT